jgi:NTE family protein
MKAFVLTGGGSLGSIHAGMLEALYERGIAPDLIVGTSVGAVNGAYIASRPQTVQTARSLGDVWRGLRRPQVFPMAFIGGFLGFTGRRTHLVPSRGLRRLVTRHGGFVNLEDAPIPLHVIATDAATGEELPLSHGNTVDAVLASAAIPAVFPPVSWDGRLLIDGGISNYAPISDAVEHGADTVYVLTSGTACGLRAAPSGAIPLLLHSMSFLITRRLVVDIEHFSDRAELFVMPPPCPVSVPPHDFGQASGLIERSYETSVAYLDGIEAGVSARIPLHLSRLGSHL